VPAIFGGLGRAAEAGSAAGLRLLAHLVDGGMGRRASRDVNLVSGCARGCCKHLAFSLRSGRAPDLSCLCGHGVWKMR